MVNCIVDLFICCHKVILHHIDIRDGFTTKRNKDYNSMPVDTWTNDPATHRSTHSRCSQNSFLAFSPSTAGFETKTSVKSRHYATSSDITERKRLMLSPVQVGH